MYGKALQPDAAGAEDCEEPRSGRVRTMALTDDVNALRAVLDRLASGVEEARAAAALVDEGDPTALGELGDVADAMAREVATLKAMASAGRL